VKHPNVIHTLHGHNAEEFSGKCYTLLLLTCKAVVLSKLPISLF